MNIIVGATGQVGSHVIQKLKKEGHPVRAVVRNADKLSGPSLDWRKADLFDVDEVTKAFEGGSNVFVLTPENPAAMDIMADARQIIKSYKKAIQATGIQKVVALSCVGAHLDGNTGNVLMSRMLEQELETLAISKVFIRPSYYFSNWLGYWETAKQYGVLPSFFPEDLKMEMHSPVDLAQFIAQVITLPASSEKEIYELGGPEKYSSRDVANTFSALLYKKIAVQPIPPEQWKETLLSAGFTDNTAANLSDMTQAVIEGKLVPEWPEKTIKLETSLLKYLEEQLKTSK